MPNIERLFEDIGGLKTAVADAADKMNDIGDRVDKRFDEIEARFARVEHRVARLISLRDRAGGMVFLGGLLLTGVLHAWTPIKSAVDWLLSAGHPPG